MFGLKKRRREKLMRQQMNAEWLGIIERNVAYYAILPDEDRRELQGLVQIFLAEKKFEGIHGVEITDEIRVTIASLACILILRRKTDIYPGLESIIVYPGEYVAPYKDEAPGGTVVEGEEDRIGESWVQGALVLSWEDVVKDASEIDDGFNVVFHEFAHQLDEEDGSADGTPVLPEWSMYEEWSSIFKREYETLVKQVEQKRRTFIDEYAAETPAEFFAVVTEYFFEAPFDLEERHADLYHLLSRYFNQDPVSFNWDDFERETVH